jgi:eukaryotic-like serine/threonine-protein kinase
VRARRHFPSSGPLFQSGPGRAFLRDMGLVLATFIVGYGISALWLSPGSMFSKDHSLPRVLEMPEAKARQQLTELGFRPRLEGERANEVYAAGVVIWQDPAPGTVLAPNSVVQLVVSSGPASVVVPDVVGLEVPQARTILTAAGIRVGQIDSGAAGQEAGVVLATRPSAGTGRPRGAAVALVVSRGPEENQ